MKKIFYIIDGYGIFFRAFYAVKALEINNIHLNAIFGTIKILTSLINQFNPKYLLVALDSGKKTFRDDIYLKFIENKLLKSTLQNIDEILISTKLKQQIINNEISYDDLQKILNIENEKLENFLAKYELQTNYFILIILYLNLSENILIEQAKSLYKANRKALPDAIKGQFAIFQDLLKAMNISHIEKENYEADDLIATYCDKFYNQFDEIIIISSDKDLKQLINNKIKIYDPLKKKIIDENECQNILNLKPIQVLDYLSLIGDRSDNIPGIPGIGPKIAIELLSKYQNIENIIQNLDNIKNNNIKTKIYNHLDLLELSYKLVKLENNIEIDKNIENVKFQLDRNGLYNFNKKYNFFKTNKIQQNDQKKENTLFENF